MRELFAACAEAHPNIALIKYWGNRDHRLNLPANNSISFNLEGLLTRTLVVFDSQLNRDRLIINGRERFRDPLKRVQRILAWVREHSGIYWNAHVISVNNFPEGVGIASSASAFAALALAASKAAGLHLDERNLSRLARIGSGSAARSVPDGFVEWRSGTGDHDSYAFTLFPPEYWDLWDCVAVVSTEPKPLGSQEGHLLAETSPIQWARVTDAPRRLDWCRKALKERDFESLAEVVELDSHLLHAVMQTSSPPLFYWEPTSVALMHQVRRWRKQGWNVCYTLDAGPNVHVICTSEVVQRLEHELQNFPGVLQVLTARVGKGARPLPLETCQDLLRQGGLSLSGVSRRGT